MRIYGEKIVPASTRSFQAGIRCDVCGKEKQTPATWGIPKGWYSVSAHTDFATDPYFADVCSQRCLMKVAKDVSYIQGHQIRIVG